MSISKLCVSLFTPCIIKKVPFRTFSVFWKLLILSKAPIYSLKICRKTLSWITTYYPKIARVTKSKRWNFYAQAMQPTCMKRSSKNIGDEKKCWWYAFTLEFMCQHRYDKSIEMSKFLHAPINYNITFQHLSAPCAPPNKENWWIEECSVLTALVCRTLRC